MRPHVITPYPLIPVSQLTTAVEQRTRFTLERCELNIYQTLQPASDFHLRFGGFTVTSMLRGRKRMHLHGSAPFDYVPGETVMCSAGSLMKIDFPDARPDVPTQCTALVIEDDYLRQQLAYLSEHQSGQQEVQIHLGDAHLPNSEGIARVSEKLLRVMGSTHPRKDTFVDLALKELVLSIVQEQQLRMLTHPEAPGHMDPFVELMRFVRGNLVNEIKVPQLCKVAGMSKSQLYREFTQTFGVSPKQFILRERITHARLLLQQEGISVKEACYAAGFTDPNYFVRAFKKMVGVTPGSMRSVG